MSKRRISPAIERVSVGPIIIYEVTEGELDALERGSPESLFLNFGIATASTATSFLIALLTSNIPNQRTFIVFVVIAVIGFLAGATFLSLWWFARGTVSSVLANIRRRRPPQGQQQVIGEPEKLTE